MYRLDTIDILSTATYHNKKLRPFSEILAYARVKSAGADEIHFVDEIKSTLPASSRISSTQGISPSKMISPTRQGGFNCKSRRHLSTAFACVI